MCVVKPNSLGVYCDGGYADHHDGAESEIFCSI